MYYIDHEARVTVYLNLARRLEMTVTATAPAVCTKTLRIVLYQQTTRVSKKARRANDVATGVYPVKLGAAPSLLYSVGVRGRSRLANRRGYGHVINLVLL